jgi:surfactin synthase thioesterase subunit/acyl carrier protein
MICRSPTATPDRINFGELNQACAEPVDVSGLYTAYKAAGMDYGPLFHVVRQARRGSGEVLAEVSLPSELSATVGSYRLHPVVLDGCLHALGATGALSGSYLPVAISKLTVYDAFPERVWCHARWRPDVSDGVTRSADLCIFTDDGRVLATIEQLTLRRFATAASEEPEASNAPKAKSTARFAQSAAAAETAEKIRHAVGEDRAALVLRFLQEELASILKREAKGLPGADKTFLELGMDSLMGLEMVYRIQNGLGLTLSEQTMLHFATIQQLADELTKRLETKGSGNGAAAADDGGSVLSSAFFAVPTTNGSSPWLRITRPNPSAAVRLFCFPNLGRGASLFDHWPDDLPNEVELCGVQLPGREDRLNEPSITSFSELTETLVDVLLEHLDRPFAFFGHSGGALVAYEAARVIASRLNLTPLFLGVGAMWPPHLSKQRIQSAGEGGLIRLLELAQPANGDVRPVQDPQAVLADLALFGSYRHVAHPPLECPIVACGGSDDALVSADDLAAWKSYSIAGFEQYVVPGNHETYLLQRNAWLEPMIRLMLNEVG